jgi:site-specific recombinase XerC
MKTLTESKPDAASGHLALYRDTFLRSLAAENKSERTRQTYGEAVQQLEAFLLSRGMPTHPEAITREHLTEWINDILSRFKASTALNRYRGAYRFFVYLVDLGEIKVSPMAKMHPPRPEEMLIPVVQDDHLTALLKSCEGKDFRERRDRALIFAFLDSGLRVSEMASVKLKPEDDFDSFIDLDEGTFWIVGKGKRQRRVPLGKAARRALDLYLFARAKHAKADSPFLWIGERGSIKASGLYQILERRCELAGVPRVHPHQLRHTWAHKLQESRINDSDHMYLAGWKTRTMLTRYGASAAAERAMQTSRRLSPADRLGSR